VKRNPLELTVQYATEKPWVPSRRQLERWAGAALPSGAHHDLTVRIVGGGESRSLNRRYRRRDKPTNVLSFPATLASVDGRRPLGDLVVCAPVVSREARHQRKEREAHWAHMIVHGTLHLLGYDHERARDAQRMERREIRILSTLGVPNPYVPRATQGSRATKAAPRRKR
jgi:probable rRNA maturation factor